jgi:hypothetical protein
MGVFLSTSGREVSEKVKKGALSGESHFFQRPQRNDLDFRRDGKTSKTDGQRKFGSSWQTLNS